MHCLTTAYCPLKVKYLRHQYPRQRRTDRIKNQEYIFHATTQHAPYVPSNFVENIKVIFNRFCARRKGHRERYPRLSAYHRVEAFPIPSHLAVNPASIEVFSQPWPVTLNLSRKLLQQLLCVLAAHLPKPTTNQNRRMLFGLRLPFYRHFRPLEQFPYDRPLECRTVIEMPLYETCFGFLTD